KKIKKEKFLIVNIILFSIVIAVIISIYLLDTTSKINQGSFRLNDLVTYSTVTIDEVDIYGNIIDEKNEPKVSDIGAKNFNVSQNNNITMYIAKDNEMTAKEIYINNIKLNYPKLTENMYIYIDELNKFNLNKKDIIVSLDKEEIDTQYVIRLNIDNSNCIKTANILKDKTEIKFDGTIFNLSNIKISDIQFKISFDLNILDVKGKLNICKFKLILPNELLIKNGISIIKEDVKNFPFKVK
ncbi:MAG: hypothetical protein RR290_04385, partial [Clostridia bacterium]